MIIETQRIASFLTKRPWNYSISLSGQKIYSYHVCHANLAKYTRVNRQIDKSSRAYSTGEEGRSICRWTGNVDFQYGISRFWEKYGWETVFLTLDGAGNY